MKALSPEFTAHLASGATRLCWCWRIARRDGVVMGFTDHDKTLTFDGTTYEAASGFTASDIKDGLGLAVDNLEVSGALSSATLTDADLAAGRYDDARVEIHRVNWNDTSQRVLMRSGSIGEVRRSGTSFAAELRGLAHYLQQPKGRLLQLTCDADLGDARCKVDLSSPAYCGTGTVVSAASARRFTVSGLGSFASGFFARGLLTFTSGASDGLKIEVKSHAKLAGADAIELWTDAEGIPAAGDHFIVTAGCDKRVETCKARFANVINFRGFPSMPGNKFLTQVGRRS
ncbi:Phage conserved hypothetical protein, gene transfer agent-like protein [Hyphomicrobium denitrificans ATCC 51888]|uniref:Bacteriophage phiJL001 Gp84 C-terminal domain-containing protein n=1 Tax=Hyphomicrobium denitrificans (strain ATCC 51888 / DSM 1869 / NCIMB 11706 / TK 0415) TaxID=582899 RepID=D8JVP6_HYPDA|nr:DUF2163 domain-containing protein [Hyphomicrobium denitrificans]ADJ22935.1 Phage conserved hypothetical protein, gene transfer agent-like protein [Hyphomicrobium denitrificans ATCC 51888]